MKQNVLKKCQEARILDQIETKCNKEGYISIWFQNTKRMYKMDKPIGVAPLKKKKV